VNDPHVNGCQILSTLQVIADAVIRPSRGVPPCASNPSHCRLPLQLDTEAVCASLSPRLSVSTASIVEHDAWTKLHCSSPHYLLASPFVEDNGETRANPSQWRLAGWDFTLRWRSVPPRDLFSMESLQLDHKYVSADTSVIGHGSPRRQQTRLGSRQRLARARHVAAVSLYSTIWKAPTPAWDEVVRVTRTPSAPSRTDDPWRPIDALSRADHTTPVPP
jgi:hypothetical protein